MMKVLLVAAAASATQMTQISPPKTAPASAEAARAKAVAELHPCNAAKARVLVGRQADTSTIAQAIKLSGSYNVRLVRVGDPISMDYSTDRITVELDNDNKVLRLTCG